MNGLAKMYNLFIYSLAYKNILWNLHFILLSYFCNIKYIRHIHVVKLNIILKLILELIISFFVLLFIVMKHFFVVLLSLFSILFSDSLCFIVYFILFFRLSWCLFNVISTFNLNCTFNWFIHFLSGTSLNLTCWQSRVIGKEGLKRHTSE